MSSGITQLIKPAQYRRKTDGGSAGYMILTEHDPAAGILQTVQ